MRLNRSMKRWRWRTRLAKSSDCAPCALPGRKRPGSPGILLAQLPQLFPVDRGEDFSRADRMKQASRVLPQALQRCDGKQFSKFMRQPHRSTMQGRSAIVELVCGIGILPMFMGWKPMLRSDLDLTTRPGAWRRSPAYRASRCASGDRHHRQSGSRSYRDEDRRCWRRYDRAVNKL